MSDSPRVLDGWIAATLRWAWGADDDVGLRELFRSVPATWIILGLVCVVSSVDFALGGTPTMPGRLTELLGISPARVADGEWWRLLTTALVNPPELDPPSTGLQHLLFNAIGLVLAGPRVERAFGTRRFVPLFVLATICGAVALFVGTPFYSQASGGTSGAVYGLIGATLVIAITCRRRGKADAIFLGAVLVIMVNLLANAPGLPAGTNISHFGGFVAGTMAAAAWCARPASRRVGAAVAAALLLVAASAAVARTVYLRDSDLAIRAEIPMPFPPEMLTAGFGSIWVTGERTGQVVRIDERSGRVTARIRVEGASGLPVATDGRLWVPGERVVAAIDPSDDRVASRVRLPDDAWGLAATKDALWAALPGPGEIVRIDLRTREQSYVAVGAEPYVVATQGRNVWATSYGGRTVSRLDPDSGKVIRTRRLATKPYQMSVLDGSLWVGAQPNLYRLDPESLDVTARIRVGDTWTLTPDASGMLVVAQRFSRSLVRVDPRANTIERLEIGLREPIATLVRTEVWIADAYGNSVVRASVKPGVGRD